MSALPTQPPTPARSLADRRPDPSAVAGGADGLLHARPHLLTVCVEDYFQAGAFRGLIDERQWDRFETRLARGTEATLDLLDQHGARATFFVLGWIAARWPELVGNIADRGHEVACRGWDCRRLHETTEDELRHDIVRARDAIEAATGRRVHGHRSGSGWLRGSDGYVLDLVAETGFAYDSSLLPRFRSLAGQARRHVARRLATEHGPLWEVPPSAVPLFGHDVPIAGGNYLRQLPRRFVRNALARWDREQPAPLVLYFHTWELDAEQPRVSAASRITRMRHYRNLDRVPRMLREILERYEFGTIAGALGLPEERIDKSIGTPRPSRTTGVSIPRTEPRTPVSIVIPCFNEELTLPFLARTLEGLRATLSTDYAPEFVFVDDHSTDTTADTLEAIFGMETDCRIVRHERNRGVAAAILTGIEAASHEIVCSMDCDCSYDPHELVRMIPLLEGDVDLVTASPYHPDGGVRNVPRWRLVLSRTLSAMYARLLPAKLHTYTSCFRVHRRSKFAGTTLRHEGFLGVAEMLAERSRRGSRIVEYPTTLSVRLFGESKMRTLRTIRQHLGLVARLTFSRRVPEDASPATNVECANSPGGAKAGSPGREPRVDRAVETSPGGATESLDPNSCRPSGAEPTVNPPDTRG